MSKEHIWPEWMASVLPESQKDRRHVYSFEDAEGEFRRLVEQGPYGIEVRDVCKPCNESWMSRAEIAAKPSLIPMMKGERQNLDQPAQMKVAYWTALKALMAHRVFRGTEEAERIPHQDFLDLYELRDTHRLPPGFAVYTARAAFTDGHAPNGFWWMTGLRRGTRTTGDLDGYWLTFSACDFVGVVFRLYEGLADGESPAFVFPGGAEIGDQLALVSPSQASLAWPPGDALTTSGLKLLAGHVA